MSLFPKGWQNSTIVRWFGANVGIVTLFMSVTGEKIGSTFTTILIYLLIGIFSFGVVTITMLAIVFFVDEGRMFSDGKATPLGFTVTAVGILATGGIYWFALNMTKSIFAG